MKTFFSMTAIVMYMKLLTVILRYRFNTRQFTRKELKQLKKLVRATYRWAHELLHEIEKQEKK